MAWSITTYAGTQGTGSPSGWRTAMFELCRAINEREDAMGGFTAQQFYKADGTQARHITMDDLLGMAMVGDDSYFKLNCERIMAWIKTNCDSFTETSGVSDAWTVANLEADVGAFAFIDSPLRNTQALFFQQCQDALDRLIYAALSAGLYMLPATKDTRSSTVVDADAEVVWDDTVADTATTASISLGIPEIYWQIRREKGFGHPTEHFGGLIYDNCQDIGLGLVGLSGTLTAVGFSALWTSGDDGGGSMSASFGSNSLSHTLGSNDTYSEGIVADLGDFTMGALTYISLTASAPGTCPLDALPSTDGTFTASMRLQIPTTYSVRFDIASELTDQS
jgi:hypothetical protein